MCKKDPWPRTTRAAEDSMWGGSEQGRAMGGNGDNCCWTTIKKLKNKVFGLNYLIYKFSRKPYRLTHSVLFVVHFVLVSAFWYVTIVSFISLLIFLRKKPKILIYPSLSFLCFTYPQIKTKRSKIQTHARARARTHTHTHTHEVCPESFQPCNKNWSIYWRRYKKHCT